MRILVTISRDWPEDEWETIWDAIHEACRGISFHKITVVHGASQMDFFIAGMARFTGMDTEPHRADWNKYRNLPGRNPAGFIRNQEMVDSGADVCLAYIRSNSSGASDCADRAEKAGIPTKRYRQS